MNNYSYIPFDEWLADNGGSRLVSDVAKVWDVDAMEMRTKLMELYQLGIKTGQTGIEMERVKNAGLLEALRAKQNIEVNFSLFRRKP